MEFVPICMDCDNFKKGDKCKYFGTPPFEIKYTEKRCPYYTGGEYELLGELSKSESEGNK